VVAFVVVAVFAYASMVVATFVVENINQKEWTVIM
jgi:hypothetical protein